MSLSFSIKNIWFILFISIIVSCSSDTEKAKKKYNLNRPLDEIIEWELANFDELNPITYTGAEAGYAIHTMFYSSTFYDYKTLQLVPVLVKNLPEYFENENGELFFTYELRPEAKWDNGSPITAKDVELSLKTIKNPKVNAHKIRPIYELIHNLILYPDNSLKYTIVYKEKYMNALEVAGDFPVIPKYIFDPDGLMDNFSVKDLTYKADKLKDDPKIIAYGERINSEKFKRDKEFLKGSGPYELVEWVTDQKIVLRKKANWWGDAFKGQNCMFDIYPSKIIHQIINDQTGALTALKGYNLDVMRAIKPKEFLELKNNEKYNEDFHFLAPPMLGWSYLSINTKSPKFSDKKTRQALCHLANVDKIIEVAFYGFAQRAIGPIRPDQIKFYNSSILPYDYNLDKARQLLKEAGWQDTNGDGVLDKKIDGRHTELSFTLDYVANNDLRKTVCMIFQEEARKVGVKVEIRGIEPTVLKDNQTKHNYEMAYNGWVGGLKQVDLKQLFHSESANGGGNYENFSNAECDALLDSVRVQIDEDKMIPYYKRFQEIIHEEAAHIFLVHPKERIAVHKRFTNVYESPQRPGYWTPGFMLESNLN